MKVYLAAPSECQQDMHDLRAVLSHHGHVVTSDWLEEIGMLAPLRATTAPEYALRDIKNIEEAEVVVVYNPADYEYKGTGGRHTELGIAITLRKWVIVLGNPTNVFHFAPKVLLATDTAEVLSLLNTIKKATWSTPSSAAA